MDATLIMPTYNKLPRLRLTISSLENQTYDKDRYEVIVVDDGSTDGTCQFLSELKSNVNFRIVRQDNNGRSSARNTGLSLARGRLIIFTDDDLILSPSFIQQHVSNNNCSLVLHGKIINIPYLKFFEDPSKGIFYSYLNKDTSSESKLTEKCISMEDIASSFQEKIASNTKISSCEWAIRHILTQGIESFSWMGFTGGNVSVSRKWLEIIGGFDTNFGLKWGCEDFELGYRLYKAGFPFGYGESAVNYHMAHYRPDMELQIKETLKFFYEKYHDPQILKLENIINEKINKENFLNEILEQSLQVEKKIN